MIPRSVLAFGFALLASSLVAQDTRAIVEPFFPQLCATLDAQLETSGGSLALADEQKLDTARIQKALDKCGKGRAVELHVNEDDNAFLTGPLELRPEVTLIVGVGVTLFASRDPALFAVSPGSCGIVSHSPGPSPQPQGPFVGGPGPNVCKPLISVNHAPRTAIMGDGVIDGRGGEKMLGSGYSWWDLADRARAGDVQQAPGLIAANDSGSFTLYRITLRNSPSFHVAFNHADGFTAWGVKIDTPQLLAPKTDGVDLDDGARNITIAHSYIRAGGDNLAIKGGPGGATNITIGHDHLYWGRGVSIGSQTTGGVSRIRVLDLSLDGSGNGIRVDSSGSRGGLTADVVYNDICIRNSPNPITFETANSDAGTLQGDSPPIVRDITLHNVRISGGGKITFVGYDPTHRIAVTLDGDQITDQATYTYEVNHADLTLGPEPTNLQLPTAPEAAKNDSTIKGFPAEGNPASCADKFVLFPQ